MNGGHHFGFRDPNGVLDQAAEMSQATRESFFECLEEIASEAHPLDDPGVMLLRDDRYPGGFTKVFEMGLIVYSGPHYLPPIVFIELIDAVWVEDDEWEDEDYYP